MMQLGKQQIKELRNKIAELARLRSAKKVFTDDSHASNRPKLCEGVLELLQRMCKLIGEQHRWFTKNVVAKVYNNAIKKLREWNAASKKGFLRRLSSQDRKAQVYRPHFQGRFKQPSRMAA